MMSRHLFELYIGAPNIIVGIFVVYFYYKKKCVIFIRFYVKNLCS